MALIFYTCTLNPAVDLFMEVDALKPDVVNRTNMEDYQPNGKTINVSIILERMGIHNTALGFLGGFTGEFIEQELVKTGVETDFIKINGITRINNFIRAGEKEFKVVNKGPVISPAEAEELLGKISSIPKGSFLFVSGSLPSGINDDIYVAIAEISKHRKLKLVLDISSNRLLDCLSFSPYLIKPNDEELASFFNRPSVSKEEAAGLAQEMIEKGAERVLVSFGSKGSLFITKEEIYSVTAPAGDVMNTACAGDALLASFIGRLKQGAGLPEALKYASAAGAATAFSMGLGSLDEAERLKKHIEVHRLDHPFYKEARSI
ncbi:1-phosphofructokinase [Peribacillus sp. SCS-26]|uniref:1-phosphofructokinase n=1 Tax=Paraperibacillus marinus TaxID=3115295 RepID=UPI0039058AD0